MKPRHLALGAALLVAAGLAVFGDKTPNAPAPASRATAPAQVRASASPTSPAAVGGQAAIARLIPRTELIADDADPLGPGDDVFLSQDWTPPPPKPAAPPPPPPPSAPPLPFTYLGKAHGQDGWEVFLARGEQTYVVHADSVIDGVYRIDAIAPPSIQFTYLPLKQVQQLNIGVLE